MQIKRLKAIYKLVQRTCNGRQITLHHSQTSTHLIYKFCYIKPLRITEIHRKETMGLIHQHLMNLPEFVLSCT